MGVKKVKNLPNHHNPFGILLASICLKQKSEHLMTIYMLLLTAAIQLVWGRRQSVRNAASSHDILSIILPGPLGRQVVEMPGNKRASPGDGESPQDVHFFIAHLEALWRRMRKAFLYWDM